MGWLQKLLGLGQGGTLGEFGGAGAGPYPIQTDNSLYDLISKFLPGTKALELSGVAGKGVKNPELYDIYNKSKSGGASVEEINKLREAGKAQMMNSAMAGATMMGTVTPIPRAQGTQMFNDFLKKVRADTSLPSTMNPMPEGMRQWKESVAELNKINTPEAWKQYVKSGVGSNRPPEQIALEKAANSENWAEVRRILDSIPSDSPYKSTMESLFRPIVERFFK